MGLRKDDRGLSSLTCNDRSDGRANRLLNYRATTAKAKKPNEELYGLEFLHGDDAKLLMMEAGNTQQKMAEELGIRQSSVSKALRLAHRCHAWVSSEYGPQWCVLAPTFEELGVERLILGFPMSDIFGWLIRGDLDMQIDYYSYLYHLNRRKVVAAINRTIKALRAEGSDYCGCLADLAKSHLRKPSKFRAPRSSRPEEWGMWILSKNMPDRERRVFRPKSRTVRRNAEMSTNERAVMFSAHRFKWHAPALRSLEDDPLRAEFVNSLRAKRRTQNVGQAVG
jgi:hypothetical protein